jgi:hypothetical protein
MREERRQHYILGPIVGWKGFRGGEWLWRCGRCRLFRLD